MPFRKARDLLREILPCSRRGMSHVSIRRHTMTVGEELHRRATDPSEYNDYGPGRAPVAPAKALTVALDGTWVRADLNARGSQFHVLAGRIERDGELTSHFAWVPEALGAGNPAFMKSALDDAGLVEESQVATLVDGADGLHSIVRAATGSDPKRQLDWFHVSMRLRHIEQMTIGKKSLLGSLEAGNWPKRLPRLRRRLWHGRWKEVLVDLSELGRASRTASRTAVGENQERLLRFRRHVVDLRRYLRNNRSGLINYGQIRRRGARISSAPAESTMTHLINERLGKRQSMRWSPDGAHRLLQVRCAVFDDRLVGLFQEWHPRFLKTRGTVQIRGRGQVPIGQYVSLRC